MFEIFHIFVRDPLYNGLVFLYNTITFEDFGVSIIAITVILKVIFLPLSRKQIESQRRMQELQPKIKAIQEKYKDDKEKQAKSVMEFYKENKVNPLGGCLPLIIQLVFLLALYNIFLTISKENFTVNAELLYPFIANPGQIHTFFLSFLDLSKPSIELSIITAVVQYWQMKMLIKTNETKKKSEEGGNPDFAQIMTKQMLIIGPILTLVIGVQFPSGLMLYWFTSTVFMIAQQKHLSLKENNS